MSLKVLEVPGEGVRTQAEVSRLGHARRLSHKRMNVRDAIAWFSEQAQFGLRAAHPVVGRWWPRRGRRPGQLGLRVCRGH